jgi:transcriptional regulator with XRE-family HTH domain
MKSDQKSGYRLHAIGTEVTKRRLLNHLTRQELAEKSGLSLTRINKIEGGLAGGVSVTSIRALAAALGCHPDDISEVVEVAS